MHWWKKVPKCSCSVPPADDISRVLARVNMSAPFESSCVWAPVWEDWWYGLYSISRHLYIHVRMTGFASNFPRINKLCDIFYIFKFWKYHISWYTRLIRATVDSDQADSNHTTGWFEPLFLLIWTMLIVVTDRDTYMSTFKNEIWGILEKCYWDQRPCITEIWNSVRNGC